jgi:hypothetical protein
MSPLAFPWTTVDATPLPAVRLIGRNALHAENLHLCQA